MSSRGTCRHLLCQQSLVRTAGWTRHGAACSACVRGTVADRWLTWMVHVYSVSSSSLTVQLYSRSRFLRLPLMNRLNIFPESRPLWVWDRNNELSHQLEHWMSHWPRSPVPCTTSRSHGLRCRAAHHCCPVKLFLQQLRAKGSGIQGCPHPDPQTAKHCCLRVCVCVRVLRVLVARQGGLSLTIHRHYLSKRAGLCENWRRRQPTRARPRPWSASQCPRLFFMQRDSCWRRGCANA